MTIYLISYDLNKSGQDYQKLFDAIKAYLGYYRVLKSAWFVSTTSSAQGIYDFLRSHIDSSDRIFISKIDSDKQGWLDESAWTWIKNN